MLDAGLSQELLHCLSPTHVERSRQKTGGPRVFVEGGRQKTGRPRVFVEGGRQKTGRPRVFVEGGRQKTGRPRVFVEGGRQKTGGPRVFVEGGRQKTGRPRVFVEGGRQKTGRPRVFVERFSNSLSTWCVKQESSERESRRCTRARMWPTASTDTLGSEWQAAETRWAARAAQRRPQIRRMRFRLSKAASMIRCRVYTLQVEVCCHTGALQQENKLGTELVVTLEAARC